MLTPFSSMILIISLKANDFFLLSFLKQFLGDVNYFWHCLEYFFLCSYRTKGLEYGWLNIFIYNYICIICINICTWCNGLTWYSTIWNMMFVTSIPNTWTKLRLWLSGLLNFVYFLSVASIGHFVSLRMQLWMFRQTKNGIFFSNSVICTSFLEVRVPLFPSFHNAFMEVMLDPYLQLVAHSMSALMNESLVFLLLICLLWFYG